MNACPRASRLPPDDTVVHIRDLALSRTLLNESVLRVRPPAQPIPPFLEESLLGRQFGHWLRQRDDATRAGQKSALTQALSALSSAEVGAHAMRQAAVAKHGTWNHWIWATPVATTASLLGIPLSRLSAQRTLIETMQALARGLSGQDVKQADAACAEILHALDVGQGPLQESLRACAPMNLWENQDNFAANRMALLWQSYEAGAALLGSAVQRLAEEPSLRHRGAIRRWLMDLVSDGGAVRNTRRFASRAWRGDGRDAAAGMVFVLDLGGNVGFGDGPHRCPGEDVALTAVAAALEWLVAQGIETWPAVSHMRDLRNACIPVFTDRGMTR